MRAFGRKWVRCLIKSMSTEDVVRRPTAPVSDGFTLETAVPGYSLIGPFWVDGEILLCVECDNETSIGLIRVQLASLSSQENSPEKKVKMHFLS